MASSDENHYPRQGGDTWLQAMRIIIPDIWYARIDLAAWSTNNYLCFNGRAWHAYLAQTVQARALLLLGLYVP